MASSSSTSAAASSSSSATRLYVGNLHYSVDEYSLIKIFSKFGKVTKMDFLFHKTGEKRGKPRGYAFVELGTPEEALKAVQKLHDHPLRGRNLVVTSASQMREDSGAAGKNPSSLTGDRRTTLSMVKGAGKKPQGAAAQIAALEAKLAAMKKAAPADDPLADGAGLRSIPGFSSSSGAASPALPSTSRTSPVPPSTQGEPQAASAAPTPAETTAPPAPAPAPPAKAPSAAFTAGLAGLPPRPRGV